ncbi:MAG: Uma2 family endonuclease [Deltaproteobacteria bacterium]|nr:Uma2 family endonuclease [Deltaproteobacteria bacterium]
MIGAVRHRAKYQDLVELPENVIGEIVDGELRVQPRPASPHLVVAMSLGEELGPPFRRGRGGPGGWVLLAEPELRFGEDVLVPDYAGWRRARMRVIPEVPYFELTPDWACEILSPSTLAYDRVTKLRVFARESIPFVWLIDPLAKTLEALRLEGGAYVIAALHEGQEKARVPPFDAIELDLSVLWER